MAPGIEDWHRRARAQILRPGRAGERIELARWQPPDPLAPVVDYFWSVSWDTPEPYPQEVIPRPVIHLAAEDWEGRPRLVLTGISRGAFRQHVEGTGRVVAAAFRPGGFRPFLGRDVAELCDRRVPAGEVLDLDDIAPAASLVDRSLPADEAVALLADLLLRLEPPTDPRVEEVAALVELAEHDRSVTRAGHLAAAAGVALRTLERRFRSYVGIGPKWVVQRCRLLDVAATIHRGEEVDWAGLAVELGYADQSHLIRSFTSLVGRPPAAYAAEAGTVPAHPVGR